MRSRPRKGITLATVLFAIVIVSVMTAASVQTATLTLRSGLAFRQSQLALYSAEAGMRLATANWPAGVSALNPGDSIDGGWKTLPNHATYRSVITRVDGGTGMKTYLMVVQGRGVGSDLTGGQRTVVRVVGNAPIYKWGVFTSGGITMSGNAGTDSYNSSLGTYAQTAGSQGSVATNGSISASGNVKIKGDCTTALTISSGSWCTGTTTTNATPLPAMAMVPCPASYTPSAQVSGGSYNSSTGALSGSGNSAIILSGSTSYYFSSLSLSGNSSLTVTSGTLVSAGSFAVGHSYTIVSVGSTSFTSIGAASNVVGVTFTATGAGSGTGQAATAPAQHVDVYVSGSVSLSGNGVTNVGGSAPLLGFSSCGSSTSGWTVSGNGGAAFTVYAPNSDLSISGNGDLYGAFIGKTFSNTGNGKLHFDLALQNTGGTTLYVLSGSWTELTVY